MVQERVSATLSMGLLVILALALTGCSDEPAVPLETTFWVCTQVADGDGELADVIADSHVDMHLQSGQASGSSGCNRYNGSYSVEGDSISLGPLMSTLMACDEDLMDQEQAFMRALESASTYSIEGETLELTSEDGEVLAVFDADTTSLAGDEWSCTGYNNGEQAVVSVLEGTSITLGFTEDGTAKGSSGCNTYSAPYETGGGAQMTFGQATVTEIACPEPEGVMEQEARYLEALSTVATYELRGDQLTLRRDDGAIAATFMRP
jgi:heat shock protein HslJ